MNLARLNWRQAGGRRQVDFELVGGAYDANGGPVGPPFGKRVALDLTPAEQERAMKGGFQYQNRLVLAPGRFDVRVIAREPSGATLGGAVQRVEIPDLRAGSSPSAAFSCRRRTRRQRPPAATARRCATCRRSGGSRQATPSTSSSDVYNVAGAGDGASDAVLQAQILSGGKPIAASKPQPIALQSKDGVPLPQSSGMSLEGLSPGRYELRIVVVDRKAGATVHRDVDFSVE